MHIPNDVVLLPPSSYHIQTLREFEGDEDNFNNTFFGKILPHATPVATEFRGKGKTISRESKTKLDFVV